MPAACHSLNPKATSCGDALLPCAGAISPGAQGLTPRGILPLPRRRLRTCPSPYRRSSLVSFEPVPHQERWLDGKDRRTGSRGQAGTRQHDVAPPGPVKHVRGHLEPSHIHGQPCHRRCRAGHQNRLHRMNISASSLACRASGRRWQKKKCWFRANPIARGGPAPSARRRLGKRPFRPVISRFASHACRKEFSEVVSARMMDQWFDDTGHWARTTFTTSDRPWNPKCG